MNKITPNICICIMLAAMFTETQLSCVAAPPVAPAALGKAPKHTTGAIHITILRDVSLSMRQDDRHKTAGEVLKMAAALLDCRVTIVEFASNARAASFTVPAQRNELLEVLDRSDLGKGTSYLKGLEKVPSTTTAVVFLSDGEPSEPRDQVLEYLKGNLACPVHAVAVAAGADELLRDMAASTGGSFYRARDARSLVDAFLKILAEVASFRLLESSGSPLNIKDVSGKLLCIGMNGLPTIQIGGQTVSPRFGQRSQDVFYLPGTDVHVVTELLTDPRNVSVALGAENSKRSGHLIVATFGGSKLGLTLERTKSGKVLAKAKFADQEPSGKGKDLAARFSVIGKDGQIEQVISGKRIGDEIVAEITTPEGPYDVRVQTIDAENRRRVSSRTVTDTEALPAAPVIQEPPPRAQVTSKSEPALFSEGSVDLMIVAHRKTGPVVLAQSGQDFHIEGLSEIDRISLEVVRGSMDPRAFAALGSAIQARWLGEDGGVQRTRLKLNGDRYTTDAVRAGLPGRVTCELTSGLSTAPFTLKAQATFLRVVLQLRDVTAHPIPSAAPQGTIIRPKFSIEVQVGDRPATPDELSEVLAAEEPQVTLSIEDSTGKVRQVAEHKGEESGQFAIEFVLQQIGTFNLVARLAGQEDKRGWAKIKWPEVRVTPSPLQVSLSRRLEDGNYAPVTAKDSPVWIPEMFCKPLDDFFYAVSLNADQPTSFFIESVATKDEQAVFDPKSNLHLLPAAGLGGDACTVTLGLIESNSLFGSHASLPVRVSLLPKVPSTICYGRLTLAVLLLVFFPMALILGRSLLRARRLKALSTEVTLVSDHTHESCPLVPEDRFWPTTELLVLRDRKMYQLAYPGDSRNGATVIGRLRQLSDGNVRFRAVEDLPDLPSGKTKTLVPGDSEIELDDTAIVGVNVGEELLC